MHVPRHRIVVAVDDVSTRLESKLAARLKRSNAPGLFALTAVNGLLFYAFSFGDSTDLTSWPILVDDMNVAIPAGVGTAVTGLVNSQLSSRMKARLVFLRWANPLPGCQAFTRHLHDDPRIDVQALEQVHGTLPSEPEAQNRTWYRLYLAHEDAPAVRDVHAAFLFARDYASMVVIMLFVLGLLGLLLMPGLGPAFLFIAILVIQWLLAVRAARDRGTRLVTTVLAKEAARCRGTLDE